MTNCPHCGALLTTPTGVCPSCQGQLFVVTPKASPASPALPPALSPTLHSVPVRGSSSKAIWLVVAAIGCFGLVVVGGIIAAVLVPNFVDALQKAKTKRTMSDMRAISVAIETYGVEHGAYPQARSFAEMLTLVDAPAQPLATQDGWQRDFRYQCVPSEDFERPCDGYGIWSSGRDGILECDDVRCYDARTIEYDRDDIVLRDGGQFVRHPATTKSRG